MLIFSFFNLVDHMMLSGNLKHFTCWNVVIMMTLSDENMKLCREVGGGICEHVSSNIFIYTRCCCIYCKLGDFIYSF